MKDNKWFNLIIPLVSVLIMAESIVLIANLSKKSQNFKNVNTVSKENQNENFSTTKLKELEENKNAFDVVFGIGNKGMRVGEKAVVEVHSISKEDYALDSINVYVKYDTSAFTVKNLTFGEKLPAPQFSKISEKTGMVIVNYLISEPKGFQVKSNEILSLMKFEIEPKKIGNFEFEITTGNADQQSVTMFVENASTKVLPFTSNKLNIEVLK